MKNLLEEKWLKKTALVLTTAHSKFIPGTMANILLLNFIVRLKISYEVHYNDTQSDERYDKLLPDKDSLQFKLDSTFAVLRGLRGFFITPDKALSHTNSCYALVSIFAV